MTYEPEQPYTKSATTRTTSCSTSYSRIDTSRSMTQQDAHEGTRAPPLCLRLGQHPSDAYLHDRDALGRIVCDPPLYHVDPPLFRHTSTPELYLALWRGTRHRRTNLVSLRDHLLAYIYETERRSLGASCAVDVPAIRVGRAPCNVAHRQTCRTHRRRVRGLISRPMSGHDCNNQVR